MKKNIGHYIMAIGAHLWEKGGFWNKSERYEDLTAMGKLGYKMFCIGMNLMGVTLDDIQYIKYFG